METFWTKLGQAKPHTFSGKQLKIDPKTIPRQNFSVLPKLFLETDIIPNKVNVILRLAVMNDGPVSSPSANHTNQLQVRAGRQTSAQVDHFPFRERAYS